MGMPQRPDEAALKQRKPGKMNKKKAKESNHRDCTIEITVSPNSDKLLVMKASLRDELLQ